MSGAAKARNKARARRGPVRAVEQEASGAAPVAPAPVETRGTVPAPRPVPGLEPARPASAAVRALPAAVDATPPEPRPASADSFARGYPAPADAVRCAMLGSPPTFWFEGDTGRLTVAVESGRLVADAVVHIGEDLAQVVAAALLNHEGEPADAVGPVRAALADLTALAGHGEAEVTVDLSGTAPRLGWLTRFDPAPWVTWHDWWSAFAASPAARTAAAVAGAGAAAVDECFRRRGLRVRRCARPGCAAPLTDRHPNWPGLWSAPGGALGPVCAVEAAAGRGWPAGLLAAAPHRVAEV